MGDNPKLTYDEARLADDFLLEALDAFMCTGDADELGITTIVSSKQSARDRAVAVFARRQCAMGKRMQFARDAVLFAALAVEAAAARRSQVGVQLVPRWFPRAPKNAETPVLDEGFAVPPRGFEPRFPP